MSHFPFKGYLTLMQIFAILFYDEYFVRTRIRYTNYFTLKLIGCTFSIEQTPILFEVLKLPNYLTAANNLHPTVPTDLIRVL